MNPSPAAGFPLMASEEAVIAVLRHVLSRQLTAHVTEWHVRRENYVVAAVESEDPPRQLIVKLEIPGERPNRRLDVMATIAGLVRAQTAVPTFDVIAVDVTQRDWPWEYLVVTQVPGTTWQTLYPRLDGPSRAEAQRQIGRSAAALHTLRFDSFGEIARNGTVADGTTVVPALKQRALRRIRTPRFGSRHHFGKFVR